MNAENIEFQTFVLGPYDGDPYTYTFPCLPQVRTGHTKVFPPRETLGPPDPNVDDTLSSLNYMDLTGGQGVSRINVSTDINRFWWGTADTRGADGWTTGPEAFSENPASYTGNCVPIGRIGDAMYALWGTAIHQWDPDATPGSRWGNSVGTIGTVVNTEGIVVFNDTAYFPLGTSGYAYVTESASRTLGAVTTVAGAATPSSNSPLPTSNPKVWAFGIHQQKLWAITTEVEGYALASSVSGLAASWFWPYDDSRGVFVKINKTSKPKLLRDWKRPDGQKALWAICQRGGLIYNSADITWEETDLWDVPPHPNFGRCAIPWRPGEALWIASGGGDMLQYTASSVAQPGQGPGGRADGMPADKRGDIVSATSDLANLYVLTLAPTTTPTTSFIEDASPDALVIPESNAVSTVIANTGIGWHPLWESTDAVGLPTRIVVGDPINDANTTDYRVWWGVGEDCWSMPCRLNSYSARQGREAGIDRFAATSYIEFGEFNAGSIAVKKLFSHAAILLDHASAGEYVELEYQTDADPSSTWHGTGVGGAIVSASTPNARTVLPLGLSADGMWSSGIAAYWIKLRIRLVGPGALESPTVQALTLSYMPLPADASHQIFTIPLPVEVDERSGKTREQIHEQLHEMLRGEEMLFLAFQDQAYRGYVAGMSHSEIAGKDFVGAITLNVIQIPTGDVSLVGEA